MLEAFQLGDAEEMLYLALVDAPGLTAADLAALAKATEDEVHEILGGLESAGLVTRLPGTPRRYTAIEPGVGLAALIAAQEERVQRARTAAYQIAERFRLSRDAGSRRDIVDVVVGAPTVRQQIYDLERLTCADLRMFEKPPCLGLDHGVAVKQLVGGVRVRCLYDRASLDQPGRIANIQGMRAAGEEGRVMLRVPFKLLIGDNQSGLIILAPEEVGCPPTALVVRPSALLDGLAELFEIVWRSAIALQPTEPVTDAPSEQERQLLALLAAGATDEAVARRLGLSRRTVQRQMQQLMRRLGADSRFQAGLQAKARGWL